MSLEKKSRISLNQQKTGIEFYKHGFKIINKQIT